MTTNEIYEKIKAKCNQNDCQEIIQEIDLRIRAGSTGGEINSAVGKYLWDLQISNPHAFEFLKEEINAYIELNRKNGIIIK
jgi:hypothetical protein